MTRIDVYVGNVQVDERGNALDAQPDPLAEDAHYVVELHDFTMAEVVAAITETSVRENPTLLVVELQDLLYRRFVKSVDGFESIESVPSCDWGAIAIAARDFTSGANRVARRPRLTTSRSKSASTATD